MKIVRNNPKIEQNQNIDKIKNQKPTQQKHVAPKHLLKQKHKHLKKNEKIGKRQKRFYHRIKKKIEHRELSRFRSQPRKNYKTIIPRSKILKNFEFEKQL